MITRIKMPAVVAAASLLAVLAVTCPAFAQSSPANTTSDTSAPPLQGNSYQGTIASIDNASDSFVINTTFGERAVTVETTGKTRVNKTADIGLSGLKAGDYVTVTGLVNADALTVDARLIAVRTHAPRANARPLKPKLAARIVRGIVAETTPALTVTGDDGKTYTVQPASGNIPVTAPATGSFSDLAVGQTVSVHGKPDGTDSFTAKSVEIRPQGARLGGKGRRLRKQLAAQ